MTDRIFMGVQDGTAVCRVSKPGHDASDKADQQIFSSENDYLKVHRRQAAFKLTKFHNSPTKQYFFYGYMPFPALPYIPFVTWSIGVNKTGERVFFPNDRIEFKPLEQINNMKCVVNTNGIWFSGWDAYDFTAYATFVVYKMRIP